MIGNEVKKQPEWREVTIGGIRKNRGEICEEAADSIDSSPVTEKRSTVKARAKENLVQLDKLGVTTHSHSTVRQIGNSFQLLQYDLSVEENLRLFPQDSEYRMQLLIREERKGMGTD